MRVWPCGEVALSGAMPDSKSQPFVFPSALTVRFGLRAVASSFSWSHVVVACHGHVRCGTCAIRELGPTLAVSVLVALV